jgi:large subunit ribosomal protein L25
MNHPVLNAVPRTSTTKGELNTLRRQGKIPAVVYGGGQAAKQIALDAKEFRQTVMGLGESAIISIQVGKEKMDAFVRERQRDTLSGEILHVDFLEVLKDRILKAKVTIHAVGIPVGVKDGGILETPAHEIEVECLPGDLPEKIEFDITSLAANHSVHVRDLPAMKGVKILTSPELVIAAVKFAKVEAVVEVAAPEAAAPGAPGAAPGAPGAAAPGAPAAAGAAPAAPGAAGADKKDSKK